MTPTQQPPVEPREAALHCLMRTDPDDKVGAVLALAGRCVDARVRPRPVIDVGRALQPTAPIPGRPTRPPLVPPQSLRHRSMVTVEGRAALIHALAHIEFNAIDLALDAVWRFSGLPEAYYIDWLRVTAEEAQHFVLLSRHLRAHGFSYGDFPAHNGLWEMAERTCDDVLARMALVPCRLEARGLDASPSLRAKLAQAGDPQAAAILDIILRDEIGHVAAGLRWFGWLCRERGLDPAQTADRLAREHRAPRLPGPFNLDARRAAGFSEEDLAALTRS